LKGEEGFFLPQFPLGKERGKGISAMITCQTAREKKKEKKKKRHDAFTLVATALEKVLQ